MERRKRTWEHGKKKMLKRKNWRVEGREKKETREEREKEGERMDEGQSRLNFQKGS